ncbi:MAG: acyl--CoA ligase [Brevundimonas sp.]|uniref:class I adenylate-forming enzyme family protein n=1 Tax=Brevundimonas sp. TaxID=1871086 RepID=UPI0025C59F8B|nr:class I adenylate-forming enzyme family protein [Brevundimonas sp.]MBX3477732.1 acyl--CoA ligase [Brevundimonas sp.]
MIVHDAARAEAFHAKGWWFEETINDLFRASVRRNPEGLALADAPNREDFTTGSPRRLTYAQTDAAVSALAGRMAARGVGKDDVVAAQLPNIVESVLVLLACARLGAVYSPLLPQFDENELKPILANLRPRLFLTVSRFKKRDLSEAPIRLSEGGDCQVVVLDRLDDPDAWWAPDAESETALAEALAQGRACADDVFTVCWTSGTEGEPKGAMRTHNNWRWTGQIMIDSAGMRPDDVILNTRPLVNMAAIGGSVMPWVMGGGALILHSPMDVGLVIQQIRDEAVNVTFMPPAFFISLLQDEALRASADLSSLRVMGTGSAAIPGWVIGRMETEFGVQIINFFGSNEGMSLLSSPADTPNPEHRGAYFPRLGDPRFDWPALPQSVQITGRLVDVDSGETIDEPGRPGELRMSSPSIFGGYHGRSDLTAAAFDADGFLKTGDLFEIAGQGELARYYRFVGRCKDIIVRGGLKIAPAELDELLSQHPGIKEAATYAIADPRLGEKVAVAVAPHVPGSVSLADIIQFLKDRRVAVFKLPEHMIELDTLPRNALQKVMRRELSQLDPLGRGA